MDNSSQRGALVVGVGGKTFGSDVAFLASTVENSDNVIVNAVTFVAVAKWLNGWAGPSASDHRKAGAARFGSNCRPPNYE